MGRWGVYVLECRDGTLYCGVTNDLDARLGAHNAGTGAKYTRGRCPVTLAGFSGYRYTRGEALRVERIVKCLPKQRKLGYVRGQGEAGMQTQEP